MESQGIIQEHLKKFKFGDSGCLFGDSIQKHRTRKNHNQYFTPEFVAEKALSFISGEEIKTN
jgi:uncharacterized membrane protein YsdA (DUF1294 family)